MDEKELLNTAVRKRRYTRVLLDALNSGELSKDAVIAMFLNYVNDQDVECILRDNDVIETEATWMRPKDCR